MGQPCQVRCLRRQSNSDKADRTILQHPCRRNGHNLVCRVLRCHATSPTSPEASSFAEASWNRISGKRWQFRIACTVSGRAESRWRAGRRISAEIKSLRLTSESSGMDLVSTVLDGILLGGLYALFAAGLSLIFGVMRLVNIAHGDLIVLSAFVAMVVTTHLGVHPLVSLVLVVPLMGLLGYGLQRGIFNRTLGSDILRPVLVSFGLTVFLQNALLQIFSADSRRLQAGNLETLHIDLPGGMAVGVLPCLMFIVALIVIGGLQLLLYHTELGRAFPSVSDDQETAQLMGINNAHLFGLAMALSLAIVSVAGVFLGIRTNFDPSIGPTRLIFAFEAIIIGGLGDLWGTLVGGVILGVAQTLAARINPGYQILAGHLVFLAILTLRPH